MPRSQWGHLDDKGHSRQLMGANWQAQDQKGSGRRESTLQADIDDARRNSIAH